MSVTSATQIKEEEPVNYCLNDAIINFQQEDEYLENSSSNFIGLSQLNNNYGGDSFVKDETKLIIPKICTKSEPCLSCETCLAIIDYYQYDNQFTKMMPLKSSPSLANESFNSPIMQSSNPVECPKCAQMQVDSNHLRNHIPLCRGTVFADLIKAKNEQRCLWDSDVESRNDENDYESSFSYEEMTQMTPLSTDSALGTDQTQWQSQEMSKEFQLDLRSPVEFINDTTYRQSDRYVVQTVSNSNATTPVFHNSLGLNKNGKGPVNKNKQQPTLQCRICSMTFPTKFHKRAHSSYQCASKMHQCETCKLKFSETAMLMKHLVEKCKAKSHVCVNCHSRYATERNLLRHQSAGECDEPRRTPPISPSLPSFTPAFQHSFPIQIPFCRFCREVFTSIALVDQHLVSCPSKPYACTRCPQRFLNRSHRDSHIKFNCEFFDNQGILCEMCGLNMDTAEYSKHAMMCKVVLHECKWCSMSFVALDDLAQHTLSHFRQTQINEVIAESYPTLQQ